MSTSLIDVPRSALPGHGNFSGHETFACRYAWLTKGVDGLDRRADIFTCDDAVVELGVGKNMVRSIRHWCLATSVIEESMSSGKARGLAPSALGKALFIDPAWDKYLEDEGTLWLLHWNLATNAARATTWYWAFNLLREQEFTREALCQGLIRFAENHWKGISPSTLKVDAFCFIRTYAPGRRGDAAPIEETVDAPLNGLGLLLPMDEPDRYRFNNGPKSTLPESVFAYALNDFWNKHHPTQNTLTFWEIVHGIGSPGRVFRLDDSSVMAYVDSLSRLTSGRLVFSDEGTARHVKKYDDLDWRDLLHAYYNP
jgi:hypothetical protein